MGRRLKSRYDLIRPNIQSHALKNQENQAKYYKGCVTKALDVNEGDHVYYKDFSRSNVPYVPGIVEQNTGPVSCLIKTEGGRLVARHHDQMFKRVRPSKKLAETRQCYSKSEIELGNVSKENLTNEGQDDDTVKSSIPSDFCDVKQNDSVDPMTVEVPKVRHSARTKKAS